MSEFAPRFNLIFKTDNDLVFFQVDKRPYNLQWKMTIKDEKGYIETKSPPLGIGQYEKGEGYTFRPFELVKYTKGIADISFIILKMDYTDKTGFFKYRMCFAFKRVNGKFKRVGCDFHSIRWLGRLKPRCKIDKMLSGGSN